MPSERFYRLPEEKRKLICRAAMKEFARVTMDKVSINQIIKNADISRGSFYTYFEDKWDVLAYIFEDSHRRLMELMKRKIRENNGNVWSVIEAVMEEMMKFCSDHSNFEFLKNVMAHANSDDVLRGFSKRKSQEYAKISDCMERWLYENLDRDVLKRDDFESFHCLFSLGMSAVAMAVREFYEGEPKEAVSARFYARLDIMKYGALRQSGTGGVSPFPEEHTQDTEQIA